MTVRARTLFKDAVAGWLVGETGIPNKQDRLDIAEFLLHTADLLTELVRRKNLEVRAKGSGNGEPGVGYGSDAGAGNQPSKLPAELEAPQIPATLVTRLEEAGTTGLDGSPGDPLCAEAAKVLKEATPLPPTHSSTSIPYATTNRYLTTGLPLHEEEKLELNATLGEQYLYPEPSTVADQIHYPVGTVFRCRPRSFIPDLQVLAVEWDTSPIKENGQVVGHNARHIYHCKFCRNAQKQKMTELDLLRYMYCWYLPAEIAVEQGRGG